MGSTVGSQNALQITSAAARFTRRAANIHRDIQLIVMLQTAYVTGLLLPVPGMLDREASALLITDLVFRESMNQWIHCCTAAWIVGCTPSVLVQSLRCCVGCFSHHFLKQRDGIMEILQFLV